MTETQRYWVDLFKEWGIKNKAQWEYQKWRQVESRRSGTVKILCTIGFKKPPPGKRRGLRKHYPKLIKHYFFRISPDGQVDVQRYRFDRSRSHWAFSKAKLLQIPTYGLEL